MNDDARIRLTLESSFMEPSFVARVCAADWNIICLFWSGESVQLELAGCNGHCRHVLRAVSR